jgi:4a-hydroxytetrahydrobiopterin dehydratase
MTPSPPARPPKLTPQDCAELIAALKGWALSEDGTAIEKTYSFSNFNAAIGFMTRVAIRAEKLDHHPEWSNVYNTVEVRLTTHDAGGLTLLDRQLAESMDQIAGSSGLKAAGGQ